MLERYHRRPVSVSPTHLTIRGPNLHVRPRPRIPAPALVAAADAFGRAVEDQSYRMVATSVVRHAMAPSRRSTTGVGPVEVRRPRSASRCEVWRMEKIRFNLVDSSRSGLRRDERVLDALLPVLPTCAGCRRRHFQGRCRRRS